MTAVLVLGGTGWLGSRLVDALLTTGAEVTCLARGSSPPPAGAHLIPRDRAADDVYDAVLRDWDAIVDLTSNRHHGVRGLEALAGHAGHW
ncbi:MAG TPA: NAD-dependent epimerase/dehydratase family protein, partial [Microcella sp.]|nr:NAD-dependent epimerase/dehydratase family protein [Microcella sp.]